MTQAAPQEKKPLFGKKAAFSLFIFIISLLAFSRLLLLPFHYAPDPNEGWNAFHAVMATSGAALYPPQGALTGNNYPPLSFYAVGYASRLTGDAIIAGRLISLFAILGCAALIWKIAANISRDKIAAAQAAIMFLAYNVTLFGSYFCLNDPQWLAHAVALLGIAALLPAEPATLTSRRVITASFLLAAAGFVKQNLIGFPLAITLWLLIAHRRYFVLWIISGALFTVTGLLLCRFIYGPSFLPDLLFSARHFSSARAIFKSIPIIAALSPALVITMRLPWQDKRVALLPIAAATCLVTGFIQRGGTGVDINGHFETLIAMCIGTGIALARPAGKSARRWLLVPFIILIPLAAVKSISSARHLSGNLADWHNAITRIATIPGNVACDNPAYCYWAGKPYSVDFFLYGQRFLKSGDTSALRSAVNSRIITAAELPNAKTSCMSNPLATIISASGSPILYRNRSAMLADLPAPFPAASCP